MVDETQEAISFWVSFVGGAGECGPLKCIYLVCVCMCTCMCVGPCMYIANVAVGGQLSGVHSLLPYCGVSLLSALAWLSPGYLACEPPVSSHLLPSHNKSAGITDVCHCIWIFIWFLVIEHNSSGLESKGFYLVSHLHSSQNQGIGSRLPGLLFWSHYLTRYVIWPVPFMPLPLVFLSVKSR